MGVAKDLVPILADLEKNGEKLRDHQLEGLSIMWRWHEEGRGGIVADEMGLGKTCMTIVHLNRLLKAGHGPFMVMCPLSVSDHWRVEITRFSCGKLEPILIIGNKPDRKKQIAELGSRIKKNQVLIIPYHIMTKYSPEVLPTIDASSITHIVCDEAHFMKNAKAKITTLKSTFILLTGTPIQNAIYELYSLLSFCNPTRFPIKDIDRFVEINTGDEKVPELRQMLQEYSIRRTKESIILDIPPMTEVVFYHGMTAQQKEVYINVLLRNAQAISYRPLTLLNQLMHVRKAVLHPYLFPGQEPEPFVEGEHTILASEKMMVGKRLLDSLLSYCIRHKHKVLVFSQFTTLLNIVEDIIIMRKWTYERLDGCVKAEDRYEAIASFQGQKANKDISIFLLSTKAGGIGLNLTNADTVIFLDNDWNPQNDIQAMARCHRIGQTKKVRVIRLVGRYTVEQLIHGRARNKLRLTEALNNEISKKPAAINMERILEHGFAKMKAAATAQKRLTDADIEKIIGGVDEKGEWSNIEEVEEQEGDVDELDGVDVDQADYFFFEGKTYRVDMADREALEEERRYRIPGYMDKSMKTEDGRERRMTRNCMAQEKRLLKWQREGYVSSNLAWEAENEKKAEAKYVPCVPVEEYVRNAKFVEKSIIIHLVEDSGVWNKDKASKCMDDLSPLIRQSFEKASAMDDIHLGDAHLVSLPSPDSNLSVVLLVALRNEVLQHDSFVRGLQRISYFAKREGASVHVDKLPRGNLNWFPMDSIEMELSDRGVLVYVYCRKRNVQAIGGVPVKRSLPGEEENMEEEVKRRYTGSGLWNVLGENKHSNIN